MVWVLLDVIGFLMSSRQSDGSLLFSGSDDRTIAVYTAKTWARVCTLTGHEGAVRHLCVSPSGSHLASASADFTIRIWFVWRWWFVVRSFYCRVLFLFVFFALKHNCIKSGAVFAESVLTS
jgi:hypothetical protein